MSDDTREPGHPKTPPLPEPSLAILVSGLAAQALMHLGAGANPVTNKVETDLGQAKYTIDLLQVLKEKTQGNLTDDEKRVLEGLLYDLRMRYVDAAR